MEKTFSRLANLLLGISFSAIPIISCAQGPVATLSLNRAISLAVQNYPSVLARQAQSGPARPP